MVQPGPKRHFSPCFDRNLCSSAPVNDAVLILTIGRDLLNKRSTEVSIKTRASPGSLSFKGHIGEQVLVQNFRGEPNWYILSKI